jgi:hypothetical protein
MGERKCLGYESARYFMGYYWNSYTALKSRVTDFSGTAAVRQHACGMIPGYVPGYSCTVLYCTVLYVQEYRRMYQLIPSLTVFN